MIPAFTNDALVGVYAVWCDAHGLTLGSADEHVNDPRLTDEQRAWLRAFVVVWDGVDAATRVLEEEDGYHCDDESPRGEICRSCGHVHDDDDEARHAPGCLSRRGGYCNCSGKREE